MNHPVHIIVNGNQAAAHVAYRVNEVCAIYPITPSSEMSELAEEWSANGQENIYGDVPAVYEMQGEGGVAGAMHGALQTGALSTTFTASQGLLLMMPNMFKIAGELTPNVIHVATRSIATHALSVFGDHSDIMAVRNTGYAFLGSSSVQEAMDFALIAQAATLKTRVPFVHFFDGFRTSHETSKIELVSDQVIRTMIPEKYIEAHRKRALNPNQPVLRGSSQGPDVFFQSREAINPFYNSCPDEVQEQMNRFAKLTGRQYRLFDYVGHPKAKQVIVAMASATQTIEETVKHLNQKGEKVGLVKVRLFRPFSAKHLLNSLPETCEAIAVLDRSKEPGATGEPLYLDIVQSIMQAYGSKFSSLPKVIGGRYGLSSKELTPPMVEAILGNLKQQFPKNGFTVGIQDDVTHLSLDITSDINLDQCFSQALFYETKQTNTQSLFLGSLKLLGNCTDYHIQGYTECDYKKSNSRSVSHLRMAQEAIKAPYLVTNASFVGCDSSKFVTVDSAIQNVRPGGKLLVHSVLSPEELWESFDTTTQHIIIHKKIICYVADLGKAPKTFMVNGYELSSFHACYFALSDYLPAHLFSELRGLIRQIEEPKLGNKISPLVKDKDFAASLLGQLLAGKGNQVPVSQLPVDGTYPTGTSHFNARSVDQQIPVWDTDLCTQCGACSMACPQGALRIKAYEKDKLADAPSGFKSTGFLLEMEDFDLLDYSVQVNPNQCNPCNQCVEACPAKALVMQSSKVEIETEQRNWTFFDTLPEMERSKIDVTNLVQQQLQEPLFKYAAGVDGCGEAPYLKLMSQLFGDRMLVANATGASSIFGGSLPTTPWSKNGEGRGPAWSNSLFEDNAEFGLGYKLALDQREKRVKRLLSQVAHLMDPKLVKDILEEPQNSDKSISRQREHVSNLKAALQQIDYAEAKELLEVADDLVKQSVWIVGGDGWAYDIGYSGLDHVLASGKNINILVLDNEVYSNTGGQMSKATPFGASAKFAAKGSFKQKKDLGMLAMGYEDVYVAQVAIGADQQQTLDAFVEAEKHDGPSLIIAYCHSPAHGIDMKNPSQYHKAAVASGQWLLYRNRPANTFGERTLQLDSPEPHIPIQDYFAMEERFGAIFNANPVQQNDWIHAAQSFVDKRYGRYMALQGKGEKTNSLVST
ncbi:MAG: thiamine pyrophosphate-dependent enzyme [Bacteroidota bacterium]